jgi:hypothetical protein
MDQDKRDFRNQCFDDARLPFEGELFLADICRMRQPKITVLKQETGGKADKWDESPRG